MAWETNAPLLERASPLRSAHPARPVAAADPFASESFIDEVAAALQVDPCDCDLRHIKNPRDQAW